METSRTARTAGKGPHSMKVDSNGNLTSVGTAWPPVGIVRV